ncbi:hypothetical protein BAU08_15645 [Bordetella bronchialis]|uniref:Uncharacterized protein n=2 Tax=Bordetella bronchialis TaxID=463025 RepID=A0A193FJZ9_9BORD|nr:hypothetical protein BAU06_15415 [Bordetella bronchialis]ANN72594.1 hypothetical protein BAU08_15645 [Bordetella bronchialis]
MMGTGALALWIDVDPALDKETDAWYIVEHLPERIDIGGYRRARRFQALEGTPRYLTLFEADTPDALASQGYLSLVGKISEQSRRIRAGFSNVARNTFRVRASQGRGLGAAMLSLRLRPAAGKDAPAAHAWLENRLREAMARHAVVGAHSLEAAPEVRARMDAVRVTGVEDAKVAHAVFIEATRPGDLRALREDLFATPALEEAGWTEDAYGIYALLYEVAEPGR